MVWQGICYAMQIFFALLIQCQLKKLSFSMKGTSFQQSSKEGISPQFYDRKQIIFISEVVLVEKMKGRDLHHFHSHPLSRVITLRYGVVGVRMTLTILTSVASCDPWTVHTWTVNECNSGADFLLVVCDMLHRQLLRPGDFLVVDNARWISLIPIT